MEGPFCPEGGELVYPSGTQTPSVNVYSMEGTISML
jgi:hypothetical protein